MTPAPSRESLYRSLERHEECARRFMAAIRTSPDMRELLERCAQRHLTDAKSIRAELRG